MSGEIRVVSETDAGAWDAFVASHPLGGAMATTAARAMYQANGWMMQALARMEGDTVAGGVVVCTKRVPALPRRVARVTALLTGASDAMAAEAADLLTAAADEARAQKALDLEVRCRTHYRCSIGGAEYHRALQETLDDLGYRSLGKGDGSYLVAIDVEDEELLKGFTSKCRRDVRKGLREGVTVGLLDEPEGLRAFWADHKMMCVRKGIPLLKASTYEALRPLIERGYMRLFGATYDGRTCNMALIDAPGMPRYRLGVATEAAFEQGVPPTGQPLHFGIMQWFRDHGATLYDLGGSPGPEPVKGHPNYTVWRFKHEFGGPYVETVDYHHRPLTWFGGFLTGLMRRLGRLR